MVVLALPVIAHAVEIKVFTTRAIATVLHEVGPDFERATGHRLNVTSDIAIRMVRRIQAGEPFDFLVAAPGQIDELIKAYLKEGQSGVCLSGVIERLGTADAIRAKVTRPDADVVSELVARGDVELGMAPMSRSPGV